eukprot:8118589-Prorocentrum_lima.AAC.1
MPIQVNAFQIRRSHKPEARSHKPEATSHKPQATSQKPKARSQKSKATHATLKRNFASSLPTPVEAAEIIGRSSSRSFVPLLLLVQDWKSPLYPRDLVAPLLFGGLVTIYIVLEGWRPFVHRPIDELE